MFRNNVSPNSQDFRQIVCVTCLTLNEIRKMYPIQDKDLFSSVTMIKLPKFSNYKVCWECHWMLVKIKKFRMRALKAQIILNKKNKMSITSLSSLGSSMLVHWLSIAGIPQMEYSPLVSMETNCSKFFQPTVVKEEIIATETILSRPQGVNCIEQDPFEEFPAKEVSETVVENETSCMDTVKTEYDSNVSSEDEPLLPASKSKVAYIEMLSHKNGSSTGTESASEEEGSIKNIILKPTPSATSTSNMPVQTTESFPIRDTADHKFDPIQLPLGYMASADLSNNVEKDMESDGPVEYHTGPKLFKNSPQLAIPKMLRTNRNTSSETADSTEPADNLYEVRMLTEEEVNEHRQAGLKHARSKLYMYFCEKCVEKFIKKIDFEIHMKNHDKSAGSFSCSICEQRFKTQEILDKHKQDHYKLYICLTCKAEFVTAKCLPRHNLKHQEVLKFCRVCDARFTNIREYYSHNQTHKQKKECGICHKKFSPTVYKQHMYKHAEMPWLRCEHCGKQFQGRNRLLKHKRNAHAPSEDAGYCVECNISFKSRALYNNHMKNTMKHIPDSEKFICEQCNKMMPTKSALRRHVRIYHENSERSECDICQKVFQNKKGMRQHMIAKHLKMEKRQKNKICELCGKAFMSISYLQQHMNSHLKLRPYKCEECGLTFSNSGGRYTHIKLKHRKSRGKAKS